MSDVSKEMIANFYNISIEALKNIVKNKSDDYDPEAFKAAQQILKERKQEAAWDEEKKKRVEANKPIIKIENSNQNVIVTDIRMPFGSMVEFMVKWAIASIPALIILFILGSFLIGVFGVGIVTLFK